MNYYSSLIIIFILIIINLTYVWTISSRIKNGSGFHIRERIFEQSDKLKNLSSATRDRFSHTNHGEEEEEEEIEEENSSKKEQTSVVVLTSLSGIYVWWPVLFGGDDSFHLLLNQEDVPRFHDVSGDNEGHIYLTAPHERTVYRLQYIDGWWISTFSNHSLMNSIRSEMPLFLNIHYISSILYVYGHSDIQIIDLLERPRARGSAPFMKRLRELSPNLRISDMIIDQIKSEGYIIGDSYGWCTIIRCSLTVNECIFLFKIPSSYDNRPYPCTATIDFSNKIIYLSLEDKILGVYLNEQTNFDRRYILAEKRGSRSTLGYDDIVAYNNVILYTDVLRPLLHICTLIKSNSCLNISLIFPSPQRTILPLRLSIIQVSNLRPPILDIEEEIELHINQTTTIPVPLALIGSNRTSIFQHTTIKSYVHKEININNIWMLMLGICIGLVLAGCCFMIYYVIWNKNRPKCKKESSSSSLNKKENSNSSLTKKEPSGKTPLLDNDQSHYTTMLSPGIDSLNEQHSNESITESSSELTTTTTTTTTSSTSYDPTIIV